MKYFLGVDLGTSSLKLLLCNRDGEVLNTASREYPVHYPKPGFSEQNPEDWRDALYSALDELLPYGER